MKKVKARWFLLAFFLTASPFWNLSNSALSVSLNIINFTLLVIAIIKSIPIIKSFFTKKDQVPVKQTPETFTNNPSTVKKKQLFKGLVKKMASRSILISIIVALLLLTLGGSMLYANYLQEKNEESKKNTELREKELKLSQDKLEYQKKKDLEEKQEEQAKTLQDGIDKRQNAIQNNWNRVETTPQVNSELVLLNLKTDINYNQGAMNSLLTAVYNDPNGACSSIIDQRNTQNHIYYMMLSFYNAKVAEYGQYRESIPGVDNSLNAFQNTLQIVKDQCTAVGYQIK